MVDCIAGALVQKKVATTEAAMDIGAKVKSATDAKVGIKDKLTADALQEVMSDEVQAQIVSGCVDQYASQGAQPIFNPLVRVSEKESASPLGGALVSSGSDYEHCVTDAQGRCRLLIVARPAGAGYQLDVALAGYHAAHATPDVAALRAGNVVQIELERDNSEIMFYVTRGNRGVAGVKVIPSTTGSFRSDECYRSEAIDPNNCQSVLTPNGLAAFHFWPRPSHVALRIQFGDGTPEVNRTVDIPANQKYVEVPLDVAAAPDAAACVATGRKNVGSFLPKGGPIAGAPPSDHLRIAIAGGIVTAVSADNAQFQSLAGKALRGKRVSQGDCTLTYTWTP